MADPSSYRPAPGQVPTLPGVYRFLDEQGRVLYVGKAKNLRSRLANYFAPLPSLHPRTAAMVQAAAAVQWTVVASEIEALTLEFAWIREFSPHYNVMFRDDKTYPYLALTVGEEIPRWQIYRGQRRAGVRYFGPYPQAWAIRETMELLQGVFQLRTCNRTILRKAQASGRPCLNGYIDRCCAPCVGRISLAEYQDRISEVADFLSGRNTRIIRELETKMRAAAAVQDYEAAAIHRDHLAALNKVLERNTVVWESGEDADVFAIACDELAASVQVFHVRAGRIRGQRGWVSPRVDDSSPAALLGIAVEQYYLQLTAASDTGSVAARAKRSVDDRQHLPAEALVRQILLSEAPPEQSVIATWLSDLAGGKVRLYQPQRGAKKALLERVRENAAEALRQFQLRRAADLTHRSAALSELGQYLHLSRPPLRLEGYDISHTAGQHQVGSLVVFEDGVPRTDSYRHYAVSESASDDTAALRQVLERRFARLLKEEAASQIPVTIETAQMPRKRFAYRPDLVVVDGGMAQVAAARQTLDRVGVPEIPVIGLAKRLEEVFLPGEDYPLILPRTSPALYLLQHLRDESHRFAISRHRKKRAKAQLSSTLDGIEGLGQSRQQALLRHFGSLKKLRAASAEELQAVPGIGAKLADRLHQQLRQQLDQEGETAGGDG